MRHEVTPEQFKGDLRIEVKNENLFFFFNSCARKKHRILKTGNARGKKQLKLP